MGEHGTEANGAKVVTITPMERKHLVSWAMFGVWALALICELPANVLWTIWGCMWLAFLVEWKR